MHTTGSVVSSPAEAGDSPVSRIASGSTGPSEDSDGRRVERHQHHARGQEERGGRGRGADGIWGMGSL